jgi:hypothetical protein
LDPEKFQKSRDLTSAVAFSAADKMISSRYKYRCQIENQGHDLLFILKSCHVIDISETRLEATNHRDKIYGLLGLTKGVETLGIRPNYSDSISKVYTDTARALIRSGQVDLLWLCQFPKTVEGLPTWVSDWSPPLQTPYGDGFTSNTPTFSASGNIEACVTTTDDMNGFITIRGTVVDEVAVIGSARDPTDSKLDDEYTSPFLTEIRQLCSESWHLHNSNPQNHQALDEATWRIAIGDKEFTETHTARRATPMSYKGYLDVLGRIEMRKAIPTLTQDQIGPFVERFSRVSKEEKSYRNYMRQMSNRRPFRSNKGYVGLGPVHILPGDLVCIILGAQVPYVLRHCALDIYQLVG